MNEEHDLPITLGSRPFLSTSMNGPNLPFSGPQLGETSHRRHIFNRPKESPQPTIHSFDNEIPIERTTFSLSLKTFRPPNSLVGAPIEDQLNAGPISINSNLAIPNRLTGSFPILAVNRNISEMTFDEITINRNIVVNPRLLGFYPQYFWANEPMAFGSLVVAFFRKRNADCYKFPYKLYNALQLASQCPEFIPHLGVNWVDNDTICVDRERFARLLGISSIEGSLFHDQGNFPSHGFHELSFEESCRFVEEHDLPGPADLQKIRFVRHENGIFRKFCTESDLANGCNWRGPGKGL